MQDFQPEKMAEAAVAFGFSHAAPLDPDTLIVYDEVRDMCAADRCGLYGHCWTCPPACGSVEQHRQQISRYRKGIIVQTTGQLEDAFDFETMQSTQKEHQATFHRYAEKLRPSLPGLLALASGGCDLCECCTYPDEPCRTPEQALSSMEAYGLFVSEVCRKNDLPYTYGNDTITYVSCYLWNDPHDAT